jgi:hypothetical protein
MSALAPARRALSAALCALQLFGCRERERPLPPPPETARPPASASLPRAVENPASPSAPPLERSERDLLIDRVPTCEVEHHGRLLDLGIEALSPWTGFRPLVPAPDDVVTRDGTTYLEVSSRALAYSVWLNRPLERLRVSLRGRAGTARRVQVSVDGRRLGVVKLPEGEPRSFDLPELGTELEAGLHRFEVQFGGASRGSRGPFAELDWLRISSAEDRAGDEGYAAPTVSDIVENVALGNVPRRSLVLRAPTTVRCFVRPVAGTNLRVALGLWGTGRGALEIVARREGAEAVTLESRRVAGGESSTWLPLDVDLSRFAGEPLLLELKAVEASRGGRIAFGEPELVQKEPSPARVPRSQVAVLVVLSAVVQARLPPWGPTGTLGSIGALSRDGAAFSRYRAPSSASGSVLASLITGLAPRAHQVEAPMLKLAPTLRTLPRLVKEANGTTAFFTSVPTTFAPFGFEAAWDAFEAFSPVKDLAATEPFARAASWLGRELDERPLARHLVVIHARGAHPPWDVTREEAQHLRPNDYNGAIEPRRAGMILGALRSRPGAKKLRDDDWTRLHELSELALSKQDAGLGQLLGVLKQKNAWENALVVVMGDAGPGLAGELPYDPAGPMTEDRLSAPLIVKLPGRLLAGQDVHAAVTASDVWATLARSLEVIPAASRAIDLVQRASAGSAIESVAQVATAPGRYSTRVGSWLLRGELGATPRLCAFDVDPACSVDPFEEHSIAARVLWLATLEAERQRVPVELGTAARTPVELDPETRAALMVWGDIPP